MLASFARRRELFRRCLPRKYAGEDAVQLAYDNESTSALWPASGRETVSERWLAVGVAVAHPSLARFQLTCWPADMADELALSLPLVIVVVISGFPPPSVSLPRSRNTGGRPCYYIAAPVARFISDPLGHHDARSHYRQES